MKILKTYTFAWWEMALIKICLISLGILLGIYFYNYLINIVALFWICFTATAVYFITRLIYEK